MSGTISLTELIGICDEISALSKEGLPLETTLSVRSVRTAGDRLSQMARDLDSGRSLSDVIRSDPGFPPFCAAVVDAGLESGNISGVLDTISSLARQIRDARLFMLRISLYPVFLFTLLWFVLLILFLFLMPIFPPFFESFGIQSSTILIMEWCGEHKSAIFPIFLAPLLVLWIFYGIWCYKTNQSAILDRSRMFWGIRMIPGFSKVVSDMRRVVFVRNLAMLIESSVPLDRALDLVRTTVEDDKDSARLNRWIHGMEGPYLIRGLRLVADHSKMRADWTLSRCEFFLPSVLLLIVAILLGLSYFFVVEWPAIQILNQLMTPFNG